MSTRKPNRRSVKSWHNRADTTWDQVRGMARRLGVPFGDVAPEKHPACAEKGEGVPAAVSGDDQPVP